MTPRSASERSRPPASARASCRGIGEAPGYVALVDALAARARSARSREDHRSDSPRPGAVPRRHGRHRRDPTEVMVTSDTRIAVIGQGYVGLPLAIAFVEAGLDVTGVDRSSSRVAELLAGHSPIDDVEDERLRAALERGFRVVEADDAVDAVLGAADVVVRLRPDADHGVEGPRSAACDRGRVADRPKPPGGPARHPPVDDLPGHDDRAVPRRARGGRPVRRRRLRPRLRA